MTRSSDRPELVIVANWREKIARSFSVTRLPRPGSLMSRCRPLPASDDRQRHAPCWRRLRPPHWTRWLASILPLTALAVGFEGLVVEGLASSCALMVVAPSGEAA